MLRPHTPLFNVATDTPSGGGGEAKATIGQTIKSALASKAELQARLDTATASLTESAARVTQLESDLTAAQTRITQLESDAAEVTAALTAHQAEVTTLKAAAQSLEVRAEAKSREKLAALGFPAAQLPQTSDAGPQSTAADLWQQAESESDPVKKGRLAAQAQKLQDAETK